MTSAPKAPQAPRSVADVLQNALATHGLERDFYEWKVVSLWHNAVGKPIREATHPVRFSRGTLSVAVKSSTWMQELQFMKREIMDRINREIGAELALAAQGAGNQIPFGLTPVKAVRFFVGTIPPSAPPQALPPPAQTSSPLRACPETASIRDPELRDILDRALSRCQSR